MTQSANDAIFAIAWDHVTTTLGLLEHSAEWRAAVAAECVRLRRAMRRAQS